MHLVQRFSESGKLLLKNCWSCSFSPSFPMQITFSRQYWPFACGDLDPSLTHGSLGPPESTSQTASRSVQLFLQGSRLWQTNRLTDRQTDTPRYSVCNNTPHLHCSEMQPNNKLCNIVVTDGTNQSHNVNRIYNVSLYQATNFLNAPLGSSYAPLSSPSVERRWSLINRIQTAKRISRWFPWG